MQMTKQLQFCVKVSNPRLRLATVQVVQRKTVCDSVKKRIRTFAYSKAAKRGKYVMCALSMMGVAVNLLVLVPVNESGAFPVAMTVAKSRSTEDVSVFSHLARQFVLNFFLCIAFQNTNYVIADGLTKSTSFPVLGKHKEEST